MAQTQTKVKRIYEMPELTFDKEVGLVLKRNEPGQIDADGELSMEQSFYES